jgi:hypothetical protein
VGIFPVEQEKNRMKIADGLRKFQKVLWAVFLVTLPVTSFPFFPGFMGGDAQVRPLALYPLFLLMVLSTLPQLLTQKLPSTLIPFFVFGIVALISTAWAFTRGIDPPLDVTVASRALRTLVTLAMGGLFYLTVSLIPRDSEDLRFTLTWLYLGYALVLVWASFQIVYILKFNRTYFNFLNDLQKLVSTRKLFDKRVSGMTYEPSWFAEQLTFVLMPLLFASVLSNYSVFRWRYRWVSIEMILLGWSAVALLFTYSRSGLALFIILVIVSLIMATWRGATRLGRPWRQWGKLFVRIGFVLVVICAVIFVAAQRNHYFSRLWGYWTDEESEGSYLYYIAFDQRFAYWETAYRIFSDYPGLGVGLGNFTFYFDEYLPYRQYRNPELLMKLVPEDGRNQVVTVKNFMLRILTETGILGTAMFLSFLVALAGCVLYLLLSDSQEGNFWGRAGLLGLVAFVAVSFSIDSFAIPNSWVVFGLITASTFVIKKSSGDLRSG